MERIVQAIYDLQRLFALQEAVATLDWTAPPTVREIFPRAERPPRRVGILCGSFNPLTSAHTELAIQAARVWQLDCVFFTLAKVTVDKERITGMSLEDRLLLLSLYTERHPETGVALVNRGLYFEQAQAFRSLFGAHTQLFFLVGMDKLVQILDTRYYQDRKAALQQLFTLTALIVANRGNLDQTDFERLLDQPENRPYRSHVHFFSLPAAVHDLSATAIRDALTAGQALDEQVPEETASFLEETHAYGPRQPCGGEMLDAYAIRLALIQLLSTVRSWAEQEADFARLMCMALSPSEKGRALRRTVAGQGLIPQLRALLQEP